MSAPIVHVVADTPARRQWAMTLAAGLGIAVDATDRPTDPDADAIVLATAGGRIHDLLRELAAAWGDRPDRPVVITGYLGAVPDHKIDGLLLRSGADIVLANSEVAARRFRAVFDELGLGSHRVVRTIVPASGPLHDPTAVRGRPWTLTLVASPLLPARRDERRHLFVQAVAHARRHPLRQVLVTLRGRPDETLVDVERDQFRRLLDPDVVLPANLHCVHEPLSEVLGRTDLCVTVGAAPAFEAIRRRVPTAVLTDYGVRPTLGNQTFHGSGVLTTWAAIHVGYRPTPDPRWAADHGLVEGDAHTAIRERIDAVRGALPPLQPWAGARGEQGGVAAPMLVRAPRPDSAAGEPEGPDDRAAQPRPVRRPRLRFRRRAA
ncbi:MAG: DUF6716 putative glycosyltransferase [Jatrophihabitans sp.]|uniref:DUF6716 putative glycosyltransferase n=1 Tax=Jatrophihabitans sp. TaxID=1932789 RepID=UPI003F7E5EFE